MAKFDDLPMDVVYHLLSKMQLQDAWELAAVSRALRFLSSKDRSFWMIALKHVPSMRSASNPLSPDDLADMDLSALKQLVLHSLKLERNWSLPNPRILGEARRWTLGHRSVLETNHLFQFPGSELFVFYYGKLLKCFNFGTGEYTTMLDMEAYVRCASYDFLSAKSVILGLVLRGGSRFNIPMLLFLKIELNEKRLVATIILHPTLTAESDCQKPFVNYGIVGAVQSNGSHAEILAYDLYSGGCTVIETDLPLNYITSRRLDFSFHQGNLYLIADDGPQAIVYCCPRELLPYGQQSTTTSILTFGDMDPLLFPTKIWKQRVPVCSQMFRDASFVEVHDSLKSRDFITTFRFWRNSYNATPPPREITVMGMCSGELTMQIGPTGHHVVASLLIMGQSGCKLVLIRYHPDLDTCSSHELELPDGVGTGPPPNVLSVDDHRGMVWLIEDGDLLSIPYA